MLKTKKNTKKVSNDYEQEMRLSCLSQANTAIHGGLSHDVIPLASEMYNFVSTGEVKACCKQLKKEHKDAPSDHNG